jgi:DNA polymerase-3 subunit alpha
MKLEGLPRSYGMHPCGKVVTIDPAVYYTGLSQKEGQLVLQVDMKDAEALGLVKVDLLGLRTVDVIYDTLDMIGKDTEYIRNITYDCAEMLEIFKNGFTDGVFQFESEGMKQTLINMIPTHLDDLGVVNALYRPGSLKYIKNYIDRKHGREQFEYLHPDLERILKISYGIIVYQEQLIEIGRMAGMRNPDLLRQATGKKDMKKLAKAEPELRDGLYKRGWTKEQVDQLWEDMLNFAKYSFNKAHKMCVA